MLTTLALLFAALLAPAPTGDLSSPSCSAFDETAEKGKIDSYNTDSSGNVTDFVFDPEGAGQPYTVTCTNPNRRLSRLIKHTSDNDHCAFVTSDDGDLVKIKAPLEGPCRAGPTTTTTLDGRAVPAVTDGYVSNITLDKDGKLVSFSLEGEFFQFKNGGLTDGEISMLEDSLYDGEHVKITYNVGIPHTATDVSILVAPTRAAA